MTVTCPSCGRKFNLPDTAVKSPYQKLKCSRCSHVFMLTTEQPSTSVAESPVEETPSPRSQVVFDDDGAGNDSYEVDRPRRRKGPLVVIGVLILIALMGACFYYYWTEYVGAGDRWLSIKNLEGQEIVSKEGKIFFISGVVFNGSTKPRRFLILRAKLYDKESKVLAEKDVVAGLSMSKESVTALSKGELEKKINDFKLSNEDNFQVGKGKQAPFSILFFDDGFDKAKEFTVEIVESPVL